jgi:hypothetical protein
MLSPGSSSPASPSKAREKPQNVLPCPRCESMNTKFCYYNNYSVNQPRHFCRQCQRYWTVGGTLRNVPVGGGSRKKHRHGRGGEPYLRSGPLAMATTTTTTPSFDMTAFQFSQLPGFNPFPSFPMDHHPSSSQPLPGMYINPLSSKPGTEYPTFQPMYPQPPHFYPDLAALQLEQQQQHHNTGDHHHVKAEFWGNHHVMDANNQAWKHASGEVKNSSMLLQLGLTSRPQVKPGHAVNGASPPHGSSTIEEEGSTPTNGYSNSGYEEGDTVSSMWQEMHDMQDIFQ